LTRLRIDIRSERERERERRLRHKFNGIISPDNLLSAWREFLCGKRKRQDIAEFSLHLTDNILALHRELVDKTYKHGAYSAFKISDPKPRDIHKATVRDRIVHHAVFSILNPLFETTFIFDSFSCRQGKGTHKGIDKLRTMLRKVSGNNEIPCHILKCDIRKFFQSVDHGLLLDMLGRRIKDADTMDLIGKIVSSFEPGLPIGNLTSQLFANVYLSKLDHFVKQSLKVPFYIRYSDDFIIVDSSIEPLKVLLERIRVFLKNELRLELHPSKVSFGKYQRGVDFLGYVQYPLYRRLRTKTKRRILKKVAEGINEQALQSYLGVLSHADSYKLAEQIKNQFWFNKK